MKEFLAPTKHRVSLRREAREDGLSAEAWSYNSKGSREIFVRIVNANGHLVSTTSGVTVRLRVRHAR
jgi:hypothetical protein